jgi:hypothetical protein
MKNESWVAISNEAIMEQPYWKVYYPYRHYKMKRNLETPRSEQLAPHRRSNTISAVQILGFMYANLLRHTP